MVTKKGLVVEMKVRNNIPYLDMNSKASMPRKPRKLAWVPVAPAAPASEEGDPGEKGRKVETGRVLIESQIDASTK